MKGMQGVGILSIRQRRGGELDRGANQSGHAAHGRASAWCLRGAELGSWRLDGPHTVSAKKEEAEALCETSLSSSWRRHLNHEAMAQQSSEKVTTQRR
jgi:hypothetical protein